MSVVSLVAKPTVADEVKQSIVETLEAALTSAKNGEITDVIVIAKENGDQWHHLASASLNIREEIGAMLLMTLDRAMDHLERNE